MIYLGPAGSPVGSTLDGIKVVKELGLQITEVQFSHGCNMSNKLAVDVGKAAKKYNIKLSIHAPFYINLASREKIKIRQSIKRILDSCERAHYMGAEVVVFHPGYYSGLSKEEVFGMVEDACREMANYIKNRGWKVLLGLETTGKFSAFGDLEETIAICKKVRGCVPVIDFAHLFVRQEGEIDYKEIFDKVGVLKLKHLHCHFSGIEYTSKGERRHLNMNSHPPFEPLAKEILKRKLDITIISETPDTWKSSLKMKKIIEKLR